jgi:hypothetical protein
MKNKQEKEQKQEKEEAFTKEDFLKALKKASKKLKPLHEKGKKKTSE